MGLVNDAAVMLQEKRDALSEYIAEVEWEEETVIPNYTVVWDGDYITVTPKVAGYAIDDVTLEAGLGVIGVTRMKYLDYLHVTVTNTPTHVTIDAWGRDADCESECGEDATDEELDEYHYEGKVTYQKQAYQ